METYSLIVGVIVLDSGPNMIEFFCHGEALRLRESGQLMESGTPTRQYLVQACMFGDYSANTKLMQH